MPKTKSRPLLKLSLALLLGWSLASTSKAQSSPNLASFSPSKIDDWHGFKRHTFSIGDLPCWVAEPVTPLPGNPWVWVMEFPDAFPDRCAEIALLERGFHLAYLNVGNTFGSPQAVKNLQSFYDAMVTAGLNSKVVLVGISRGGLYAYNWAAQNPDRVSVIYGDAPVCDFKSWPGGKEKGPGSPEDWQALLKSYEFKDETEALAYKGNPIDELATLAKAKVAIIHVVGDADNVVPVAENTAVLEAAYRSLGGEIEVLHKPGIGHHPHGLEAPQAIVDFIVKHALPANKADTK